MIARLLARPRRGRHRPAPSHTTNLKVCEGPTGPFPRASEASPTSPQRGDSSTRTRRNLCIAVLQLKEPTQLRKPIFGKSVYEHLVTLRTSRVIVVLDHARLERELLPDNCRCGRTCEGRCRRNSCGRHVYVTIQQYHEFVSIHRSGVRWHV